LSVLEEVVGENIDCGDDEVDVEDNKNILLLIVGDFEIIIGLNFGGNSS
jgi:hypothetical protein